MSGGSHWWRWFSPSLLLATSTTLVIGLAFVRDVADTLRRAQLVHGAAALLRAELVCDAVATQYAAGPTAPEPVVTMGGLSVRIQEREHEWLVAAEDGEGQVHRFTCALLPGAAPAAFAGPATVVDRALLGGLGGGRHSERSELPCLDEAALARAVRADLLGDFRRDLSVALTNFDAGTDGDDFVWVSSQGNSPLEIPGDLLVVPGHLWIGPGSEAFDVRLRRDLVVVVRGNLYIGRSLRVHGGGRLLITTSVPKGAVAFADRDGNGRWSKGDELRGTQQFAGPVEGGGAVYLGLGSKQRRVDVAAGIVAAGEVHVATACAVAGPLVVPFGITRIAGERTRIEALGGWSFQPERERVPGFVTSGPRRPSLLQRAEVEPTKMAQQPLYLSTPLR